MNFVRIRFVEMLYPLKIDLEIPFRLAIEIKRIESSISSHTYEFCQNPFCGRVESAQNWRSGDWRKYLRKIEQIE